MPRLAMASSSYQRTDPARSASHLNELYRARTAQVFAIDTMAGYQDRRRDSRIRTRMEGETLASSLLVHRAPLLRYLRARGAGDEADDLLQELWLKVEAAGPLRVDDELAYIYRMAHNIVIDRRRGEMRRWAREGDSQGAIGTSDDLSAERTVLARDQLDRVEQMLRGLGERTDHIFRRHRVEEIPQRQIAEELGISLSAVEKHLQKAYRAIANWAARHRAASGEGETTDGRR